MRKKSYETFRWYDQKINGQPLQGVDVRIFKPINKVISNNYKKLIATDGSIEPRGKKYPSKHISKYTYVILSTGFYTHYSSELPHLSIKVYFTSDFDASMLDEKEFLEKPYVLEAIKEYKIQTGFNYEKIHLLLQSSAEQHDFEKVEQLFTEYQISEKHQLAFWKEMYQKTVLK